MATVMQIPFSFQQAILFYNDLFELFKNETFANLQKLAPEELKMLVKHILLNCTFCIHPIIMSDDNYCIRL